MLSFVVLLIDFSALCFHRATILTTGFTGNSNSFCVRLSLHSSNVSDEPRSIQLLLLFYLPPDTDARRSLARSARQQLSFLPFLSPTFCLVGGFISSHAGSQSNWQKRVCSARQSKAKRWHTVVPSPRGASLNEVVVQV